MKNNKGFTLVELIVVVAIIGVLAGLVGLSVSTVSSTQTRKTAASVNALISKCRMGSMSRAGDVYMTVELDADGDIVCNYYEGDGSTPVSTDRFSTGGASVSYALKNASGVVIAVRQLGDGNMLKLAFDRATGAQKAQDDGSFCTEIRFDHVRTFTITLYPETGSHELA